jgi:hypothetical protein
VLTPDECALLAAVQDRLIPRDGDVPGAGESGAAHRVDGYLGERPQWRPELLAALQAIDVAARRVLVEQNGAPGESAGFLEVTADGQDAVLRAVEAAQPRLFWRLLHLTYTAYYADARVQRALGYAAGPPLPRGHALPPFDESRLEAIRRRGKLWRDA